MALKDNHNWANLANFCSCRYDYKKNEAQSDGKTQKSTLSWSIQFWIPIANVSENVQHEKNSLKNLTHWTKNLISINDANYMDQQSEEKEKSIQLPSFTSEQHLSTRSKTSMHLQKVKFFLVFVEQIFFPTLTDPPTIRFNNMFPYYLPQNIQCCKRSKKSKDNWFWKKTVKGKNGF